MEVSQDKISRLGHFSRDMLQNEQFKELIETIRDELKEGILNTDLGDAEHRELLYLSSQGIKYLLQALKDYDNKLFKLQDDEVTD